MIGTLLKAGEDRLIVAVETGQMPLNVAATIAGVDDEGRKLFSPRPMRAGPCAARSCWRPSASWSGYSAR